MRCQQDLTLWGRLFQQLPRLNLVPKALGNVLGSTIEACMCFAHECRAIHTTQMIRYVSLYNRNIRGRTQQRILSMHDDKIAMFDLYEERGRDSVPTMMSWRQMNYIGHIARRDNNCSEKRALTISLVEESMSVAHRGRIAHTMGLCSGRPSVP